jgi:hypothetical protein
LRRAMLPACERSDPGKWRENHGLLDIYRQCELNLSGWFATTFSRSVPGRFRSWGTTSTHLYSACTFENQ